MQSSIGAFQIIREVGRGGMGIVFLARDTRLDREVAIKALPADFAGDAGRLARFQREAKVLASLNHPNVASIYGLEQVGNDHYLVLEYVEGESLATRLARGPIPVEAALDIAKQIAEAVEAAHDKGIVHRDLKPGNVMLRTDGVVKVLDFGLARTGDDASSSSGSVFHPESPTITSPAMPVHSPTIAGAILGTAGYMSPEQARGKGVDKRSDIFSFGCVLYEMLTGAQPFRGETVTDSLGATLHRDVEWKLLPPGTPARVRELLVSCLAKDRKNRLHDIGDARITLERAISGQEWASIVIPAHARSGVGPALMGGLIAAGMIALGFAAWSTLLPRERPHTEPICVAVTMPTDAEINALTITPDGRTIVAAGKPKSESGSASAQPIIYTRRFDSYQFTPLAGTEGASDLWPTRDSRGVYFKAPVAPGAAQFRLSYIPLDGSAPATPIMDWPLSWSQLIELASGDLLIYDQATFSVIRHSKTTGTLAPPIKLDAGRPGIVRYDFHRRALPGDRGALINVISYGSRGYQHSVGLLNLNDGRVKVLVEDGGQAAYAPTGHLVFSRGDTLLAAPFDLERFEVTGSPLAVWDGLDSGLAAVPGRFELTDGGALFHRTLPAGGWGSPISIMNADGKIEPWSSEPAYINNLTPSPDGSRVLLQIVNARNIDEFWVSPLSHPDLVKLRSEPNADSFNGVWSPDGRQIAYSRVARDDDDGIYLQSAEGGEPRCLFKPRNKEQFFAASAWFPDGRSLLINLVDGAKPRMMTLPVGESEVDAGGLTPFMPSDSIRTEGRLTRDGRLLAYMSDESGKVQNWVVEIGPDGEAGRPMQVKTAGSTGHAWSLDGKSLYVRDERDRLMKVAVSIEPQLSVSAPVEIADFGPLGVRQWIPLPEGRFMLTSKPKDEVEAANYNLVLNWTEVIRTRNPGDR